MQANIAQASLLQHSLEASGKRVWLQTLSHFVDTDIVKILCAIGAATELAVTLLFGLLPQKKLTEVRNQRKRSQARFCLGGITNNLDMLTIQVTGRNGMTDGDRIVIEVDCVPLQTKDFAAPQSVEGSNLDWNFRSSSFPLYTRSAAFTSRSSAGYVPITSA